MQSKIRLWLNIVFILVLLMMGLGAATRLTDSGLSIVNWDLISGFLPPLSDQDWQTQFDLYKQTSQFKLQNSHFVLTDFKQIFFLEYVHRLLGRVLGFVFLLPLIFFYLTKQISIKKDGYLFLLLALGLAQGVVGIWMVKSGLVDRVSVEPVRLLIHFSLALAVVSIIVWKVSNLTKINTNKATKTLIISGLIAIIITVILGVFTAGYKAGLIDGSFPYFINGKLLPDQYKLTSPLANLQTIQANHRIFAYLTSAITLLLFIDQLQNRKFLDHTMILLSLVVMQVFLGVMVLSTRIDVTIAVAHQINAVMLFLTYLLLFKRSLRT